MASESGDRVAIDKKDLEQDKRQDSFERNVSEKIAALERRLSEERLRRENHFEIFERDKGKIDGGSLAKMSGAVGLLFTIVCAALGNWFVAQSEETRQAVVLHANELERIKGDLEVLSVRDSQAREGFATVAAEAVKPLQSQIDRVSLDIEKLANEIAKNEERVNATLNEAVIEQRFEAADDRIDSIIGRFERVTEVRLTGQIETNSLAIQEMQRWRLEELQRQRDISPLTVEEQ